MRHGDLKLTMIFYTDASHTPLVAGVAALPSFGAGDSKPLHECGVAMRTGSVTQCHSQRRYRITSEQGIRSWAPRTLRRTLISSLK